MEQSVKAAGAYRTRAEQAIAEAEAHLKNGFIETAVSTAYYACFYAVHSRLAGLGINAGSHKQAGIEFRRLFIKTKKLHSSMSETWQALSEWRMEVDYAPLPDIDTPKANDLVGRAKAFVSSVLAA